MASRPKLLVSNRARLPQTEPISMEMEAGSYTASAVCRLLAALGRLDVVRAHLVRRLVGSLTDPVDGHIMLRSQSERRARIDSESIADQRSPLFEPMNDIVCIRLGPLCEVQRLVEA